MSNNMIKFAILSVIQRQHLDKFFEQQNLICSFLSHLLFSSTNINVKGQQPFI